MENILVVGTNTRPIACSIRNLDYAVYSADYFGCRDLHPCVNNYKSVLSQKPFESTGFFSQKFDKELLIKLAEDYVEQADKIICCSGASPQKFPKHKLIGNKDVSKVENKYKLYKQLRKSFGDIIQLPETYLVHNLQDAFEIAESSEAENFLLKPLEGSGGYGIRNLDSMDHDVNINEAILQEIVVGSDVSASVLSTGDDVNTILTSQQLIGNNCLGQKENYGYCGNIAPYIKNNSLDNNNMLREIAEEVVLELKLIGSNGVDMIVRNGNIHLIEVNPRLQGTFEVAESSLGINMIKAHIMACEGELMNIPTPKSFAVKMIIFSQRRSMVGNLDMDGVYDKPFPNVIIEEGEPVVTVLTSGMVLEDCICKAKNLVRKVYQNLKPISP
jgi:predicted ATP-grasp superfamily ATP-dependent carboligase